MRLCKLKLDEEKSKHAGLAQQNGCLGASLVVLSMQLCKLKLDEEKSKHAGLAQQNGCFPTFFLSQEFAEAGERYRKA
jgi:hypothetical protein